MREQGRVGGAVGLAVACRMRVLASCLCGSIAYTASFQIVRFAMVTYTPILYRIIICRMVVQPRQSGSSSHLLNRS